MAILIKSLSWLRAALLYQLVENIWYSSNNTEVNARKLYQNDSDMLGRDCCVVLSIGGWRKPAHINLVYCISEGKYLWRNVTTTINWFSKLYDKVILIKERAGQCISILLMSTQIITISEDVMRCCNQTYFSTLERYRGRAIFTHNPTNVLKGVSNYDIVDKATCLLLHTASSKVRIVYCVYDFT
jgi:hypothetical protein